MNWGEIAAGSMGVVMLIAYAALIIIVIGGMAKRRNRSEIVWVLVAAFFSFIFAALALLALGRKT